MSRAMLACLLSTLALAACDDSSPASEPPPDASQDAESRDPDAGDMAQSPDLGQPDGSLRQIDGAVPDLGPDAAVGVRPDRLRDSDVDCRARVRAVPAARP